ncbi:hypothetical protein [Mycolicibacterium senegalense]|uniref:Uncharacterized protein n=1 Tax=Mycolicibacterium senegalense TaxID=1796 RepID=A0ABR5G251_9MYCO|nr:hypothetical protein [Mycolicibacterium senegalense]KLI05779.1 hypothetical protein AA982_22725 [Mycolicibacterium senegalense]KLO54063.1 hypothetical protein ABW05_23895 [Mycolicibacterium senegalense]KLO54130.1 hypothetical protein ABW05_24335 [Mycolicibacterium senegalense]
MTEVCEVWSTGQLAALVIGTTLLASAGVLAVILGCVRLAHSWPEPDQPQQLREVTGRKFRAVADNFAEDSPASLGKAALGDLASGECVE